MGVNKRKGGKQNLTYNYNKLKGRMTEKGETQDSLSKKTGISVTALWAKFQNKSQFKQNEIAAICDLLDIDGSEIALYFFSV